MAYKRSPMSRQKLEKGLNVVQSAPENVQGKVRECATCESKREKVASAYAALFAGCVPVFLAAPSRLQVTENLYEDIWARKHRWCLTGTA